MWHVCRVSLSRHSAKMALCWVPAVCREPEPGALGTTSVCRVSRVCRVLFFWCSVNRLITECPIKCTRQRLGHSANSRFPVVMPATGKLFVVHLIPLLLGIMLLYIVIFLNNQSGRLTVCKKKYKGLLELLYLNTKDKTSNYSIKILRSTKGSMPLSSILL